MATVYVSMGPVLVHSVFRDKGLKSGVITSGVAASSTGSPTAAKDDIAQVVCATAVYATGDGAATPVNGIYVPADTPAYIAMTEGGVISVIDV